MKNLNLFGRLFLLALCLLALVLAVSTEGAKSKLPIRRALQVQPVQKTVSEDEVKMFISEKLDELSMDDVMHAISDLDVDSVKNMLESFAPATRQVFDSITPDELMEAVKSVQREDVDDTLKLMRHYFRDQGVKLREAAAEAPDFWKNFDTLMKGVESQAMEVLAEERANLDPDTVVSSLTGLRAEDVLKDIREVAQTGDWELLGVSNKEDLDTAVKAMTPQMIQEVMDELLEEANAKKAMATAV